MPDPFCKSDHARAEKLHIDETSIVASLYQSAQGKGRVMIDVGAHYGSAARRFHEMGWSVYCFEPDSKNREHLLAQYSGAKNVVIDPRAVSDRAQTGARFYRSAQSTGISSLSAFHESHRPCEVVDVTTLSDIVREKTINRLDFLKIDVEGHDLDVLKGAPWDRVRPDVIECEFEDAKTLSLGHGWRVIADFLCEKGYAVYVSEWHPIVRYGVRHDWRRVFRYDRQTEVADGAWGNFLAFAQDPGEEKVYETFDRLLEECAVSAGANSENSAAGQWASMASRKADGQYVRRPAYAPLGDWLRRRAPFIYRVVRSIRIFLGAVWKRRT